MNLIVFNWRDIKNPESGGAEVYTHQISKRLVERGHNVTVFASKFPGCRKEEVVDGVRIIRDGDKYTVYFKAFEFWKRRKERYDIVVDEINTIPFFTYRFVRNERRIALIHQLSKEFWFCETPFPVSHVGHYFLEDNWMKKYVNYPTITVSNSSRRDLLTLGFRSVFVVHNGVNVKPVNRIPEKNHHPTVVFVGRMKRAKKPDDVVRAFKIVKKEIDDAVLWMIGDGYLRKELEKSKIEGVKFYGYLSSERKDKLVSKAWVIAVPGVREGWGQVVTDANALGTPAVGYNIPGLRDSIRNGYNGILVDPSPESLAEAIVTILTDDALRKKLCKNALRWAGKFTWDRSAEEFEKILKMVYNGELDEG